MCVTFWVEKWRPHCNILRWVQGLHSLYLIWQETFGREVGTAQQDVGRRLADHWFKHAWKRPDAHFS